MANAGDGAVRRAARILLLDATNRVLLFRGRDPARPENGSWWFTVGGGLEPGETEQQGAARELFEETGLRFEPAAFGEAVHADEATFDFGGRFFTQSQTFFLLRADASAIDTSGFEELEASSIVEHRWWTLQDLQMTPERFYPECLAALLDRLLKG